MSHLKNALPRPSALLLALSVVAFVGGSAASLNAAETDLTAAFEAPAKPAGVQLVFFRDGEYAVVTRADAEVANLARDNQAGRASRLEAVARAAAAGPTESEQLEGIQSALPKGSSLARFVVPSDNAVEIYLDLPDGIVGTPAYNDRLVHAIADQFHRPLIEEGVRSFRLMVKDPATGEYKPIRSFLPPPKKFMPQPDSGATDGTPPGPPMEKAAPPAPNTGPVTGALTGKAVVLNQGHGWLDDDSPSGWRVQRSKLQEQLEDYSTAEFMNAFVIPMLLNCGAKVQPVRECDMQPNMVLIDNASPSGYAETGTWANSTANGFVNKAGASWTGVTVNPFGNASATRYANAAPLNAPTATATYTPAVPADGYYNVYISFSASSNRTTNAHWQVHHTGGVSDFRINQKMDGATWLLLGNFYFKAGTNPSTGKVVVLNDTSDAGVVVTCDAVRFGGGMGDVARRTHGVSGKERWHEEALNYLTYLGCNASGGPLAGDDTVTYDDEQLGWSNRPAYANWEQTRDSEGANLIYIGFHTNAFDGGCSGATEVAGTARGTGSFRDVDADATAGTENLTAACHAAVVDNIKKFYDATWSDRGITASNSYGECSQGNLGSVSGFFYELLFADNPSECAQWKDPKFRHMVARGIVQGVITYYGGSVFPPESPVNFRVRNTGGGQVRLDWAAGPVRTGTLPYGSAATGYRVYQSSDGYGFDNGTVVVGSNVTLAVTAGQTRFFRVAAANSAGLSFPTETLAARSTNASQAPALIVNGSQRFDQFLARLVPSSGGCANNLVRKIDPRNFQSFNYAVQHGAALGAAGVGFDSCAAQCVESGLVALTPYAMVDWIGAQEAETATADGVDDSALKPNSITAVQNYLQAGGRVLMSNAELAWDFDRSGAAASKSAFMRNYMKAAYSADDANTYAAQGSAGGIFASVGSFNFDDGTHGTYEVRYPDVLTPNGGGTSCMSYVGGTGGTAAVQYAGTFGSGSTPGKVVCMGFGLETIYSSSARQAVMNAVVNYFGVSQVGDWTAY
jgi:hypothetical protein